MPSPSRPRRARLKRRNSAPNRRSTLRPAPSRCRSMISAQATARKHCGAYKMKKEQANLS